MTNCCQCMPRKKQQFFTNNKVLSLRLQKSILPKIYLKNKSIIQNYNVNSHPGKIDFSLEKRFCEIQICKSARCVHTKNFETSVRNATVHVRIPASPRCGCVNTDNPQKRRIKITALYETVKCASCARTRTQYILYIM